MNKFYIFLIGLLIFGFVIFGWVTGTYNGLITQRTEVQTQQAQIETQLQRRFDLVPNLVESVKGAMVQEQAVFKAIADARTKYAGAKSGTPDKLEAAAEYQSALARLLVIIENYPVLKSVDTVTNLMSQLEGTENRISVSRQRFNESVQVYNRSLQTFPSNLIGGMFNFEKGLFFEGVEGSEVAPKVDLNTK